MRSDGVSVERCQRESTGEDTVLPVSTVGSCSIWVRRTRTPPLPSVGSYVPCVRESAVDESLLKSRLLAAVTAVAA